MSIPGLTETTISSMIFFCFVSSISISSKIFTVSNLSFSDFVIMLSCCKFDYQRLSKLLLRI